MAKEKKKIKNDINSTKQIVISNAKYYCTACGTESEIRYSNWSSVDKVKKVSKDESLCSRCFKQRMGFTVL